jgi:hypothetical protein
MQIVFVLTEHAQVPSSPDFLLLTSQVSGAMWLVVETPNSYTMNDLSECPTATGQSTATPALRPEVQGEDAGRTESFRELEREFVPASPGTPSGFWQFLVILDIYAFVVLFHWATSWAPFLDL